MTSRRFFYIIAGVVVILILVMQCFLVVDVTEYAVVTFFGNPVRTLSEPGLKFKWPFPLEQVQKYSKRLQILTLPREEYLTRDKKNVMVQAYMVWRIAEPVQFMQAVGNQTGAEARLSFAVASSIGAALGEAPFSKLISVEPEEAQLEDVVGNIAKNVKETVQTVYGVEIMDLQLSRLNYHEQNRLSVFQRMREERRQIATRFRSEGGEEAMKIRASAEREQAKIIASAESEASKILGEGEAEAATIYAKAIKQDPQFYRFYRSLLMYDKILTTEDSVIIPADSDLMRFLLDVPEP